MDYILLLIYSIAERKDVGKSKSLRKSRRTVEERLSDAGFLLSFLTAICKECLLGSHYE